MAVAFHASMFGQLAKHFKQNFVDPLDKPGKRTKTYERVLSFFTQHVFTHRIVGQDKEIVDNGCAISMIEILTHVFPEFLQPTEEPNLTSHFITPLLMLLQPGKAARQQETSACFCLRKIVQYLIRDHKQMITQNFTELLI